VNVSIYVIFLVLFLVLVQKVETPKKKSEIFIFFNVEALVNILQVFRNIFLPIRKTMIIIAILK